MELRHLRYFIAVAEELHFGRAARRLGIVQPALSMQIKSLEEELGVRLLNRTRRTVELTEAGRLFLEEAHRTQEQAERAARVAIRAGRGELGRLDIGFSFNAALSGVLARVLKAFRQRAPDIELVFHELHPNDQLAALLERRLHVGFITAPSHSMPTELITARVGAWRLMVALPAEHPLSRRDSVPVELLMKESLIDYSSARAELSIPTIEGITGFVSRTAYRGTNIMAGLNLVAAGFGVTLVPESIVRMNIDIDVAYRPLTGVRARMETSIAYRRDEQSPAVQRFAEAVQALPKT